MSLSPHSSAPIASIHEWIRPSTIAVHEALRHMRYSPSSESGAPQVEHASGVFAGLPALSTTSSTYGMTSFRRDTRTSSPTPIPSARTRPALCRLARCTVAPASSTGSTIATGVTRPLGPVSQRICTTFDTLAGDENLNATAPRGRRFTSPSTVCAESESTYTTSPSIS